MLSNNPPPAVDLYADEIENIKARIDAFGDVTPENAGDARDLIGLAKQLAKDIDATRATEKQPHWDAGKAVDAAYRPLIDAAKAVPAPLEKALLAHINEQKRQAEEARLKAERIAAEAAAKARALEDDAVLADIAAEKAEADAQAAKLAAAREKMAANVKGSEGFRAAGVRVTYTAKITDWRGALDYYGENPKVRSLIQSLANADVRSGAPQMLTFLDVVKTETLV